MHYDHYDGRWTIKWAWMTEFLCIMIRYVNICHYDRCMGQLCQLTLILASLRPRLLRIWRPVWHGMTYSPNYPIFWHLWAWKYQSPRGLALIMLLCIRFETKLHVILLVSKIVPPPCHVWQAILRWACHLASWLFWFLIARKFLFLLVYSTCVWRQRNCL